VAQLLRDLLKDVVDERFRISRDHSYALLKLLESPEEIVTLMPQEVYVAGERRTVDMALGNKIVFEFKSSEREFEDAERSASEKYWPLVSKADYFIVTNWDKWRIYRVTRKGLEPVEVCDRQRAVELLRTQVIPHVKEIKIPPLPQNVEALYKLDHENLLGKLREVFNKVKNDTRIKPLYEAYKSMMGMLYGKASEEFFEDLFIRHTYMQVVVLASLSAALGKVGRVEDVCGGSLINIDIALPYLNWWRIALYDENVRDHIGEVLRGVVLRTNLIDWGLGTTEDVFRTLYEFLVEPSVRRGLGEYYTPIWLVEMVINEFDVKGRIILDPFCGSGTFLVKSFYKKCEVGEDPDSALNEVVGFDINPLAIAVARAELVIAYKRVTGREPENPPHVYHADTFASWFGEGMLPAVGLEELSRKARAYLQTLLNFRQLELGDTFQVLSILRNLEKSLTYTIRFSYSECKLNEGCLEKRIESYLEKSLSGLKDDFTQKFLEHFKKDSVARTIANLIVSHGGNDVWAVVLISIYTPLLMARFKPDIIVTNPPWIPVTEYNAPYSSGIREYMLKKIRKRVGEKSGQVLAGADIAAAALGKSIELVNEGVGFIMSRDQLFNYRSSVPSGIVATYSILEGLLKNTGARVKLLDFDFNVFQHGIYPAVIIIRKG
jgi:hypothetical protein